jgi:hypothetical protein
MLDRIETAGARHIVGKFKPVALRQIHTAGDTLARRRRHAADFMCCRQFRQWPASISRSLCGFARPSSSATRSSISSIALGERLELEQKLAWTIGRTIRRMRAEYPDRVRRIVDGPTADGLVRRRSRKPAPATTREPSADTAGQAEPPTGSEPPTSMPGAFAPDC